MKELLLFILLVAGIIGNKIEKYSESESENHECSSEDITLKRFIIEVDGDKKDFYSFTEDVEKIVEQENIELQDNDFLNINVSKDICYIEVVRSQEQVIKEIEEIPFTSLVRNSSKLTDSFSKIIQKGRPGYKEIEYKVIWENGKERYRKKISETTIKPPRPEIIIKGQSLTLDETSSNN